MSMPCCGVQISPSTLKECGDGCGNAVHTPDHQTLICRGRGRLCLATRGLLVVCVLGLASLGLVIRCISSHRGVSHCPQLASLSVDANISNAQFSLSCVFSWMMGRCLTRPGQIDRCTATAPPSEVPYYGRSPPVYPSPQGSGTSDTRWTKAYRRAKFLTEQMTLEEKINMTYGHPGPCAGNSMAVPRLGVPSFCFSDAPTGVRGQEFVSGFPAGSHVAATFDADLMYQYGEAIGREFYGKGIHFALGPVAGPLGRLARGGRNWESLGSDPYLAGIGLGAVTRGMQAAGVVATPKHFVLNEQEFRRRDSARQHDHGIVGEAVSTNVDDRTLHELYVYPFMNALQAGAGSIMCSYQRVNHSYVSQNAKLLNGILKTELGFEGFVVSDWDAQHSGVAAALAGLDVAMPDSKGYWDHGFLLEAVKNGSVEARRIDDMATRLLAAFYYVGEKDLHDAAPPSLSQVYSESTQDHPIVDVQVEHAALIRAIGAAGTVLVKNVNNTLPLRRPRFLCVYGYDAILPASPWDDPARFGGGYDVNAGWNTLNGTLITGGGSGGTSPPYVVSPFQALQERVVRDHGILRWDFYSGKPARAYAHADACLVFINAYASESFDRPSLVDSFSDSLVQNIASMCSSTIVVVHAAGIRVVDAWIDHPNVTAVLFAGLPGQESGHSLTDILYGDVNPSGRLPYTVARRESDYGRLLNASYSTDYFPDDDLSEGLYTDYRAFDQQGLVPRFPFGYGLSYTTFSYGPSLAVRFLSSAPLPAFPDPQRAVVQGGHPDLWETVAQVACSVTNTGKLAGTEVVQLYIGVPGADTEEEMGDSPIRQLRGFHRTGSLAPGQVEDVVFALTRRDLSVWDIEAQQWRIRRGVFKLYVGASSRHLYLNGTLEVLPELEGYAGK